jgi:type II secretion system protein G
LEFDYNARSGDIMGKRSFTLIELLMVIVIVGILAGATVPMFSVYAEGTRMAKARADLDTIRLAAHMLHADTGFWPTYSYDGKSLINTVGGGLPGHSCPPDPIPGWKGPYLTEWKKDPWGITYAIFYYDPTEIRTLSAGPDRMFLTADDIAMVITMNRNI